MVKYVRSVNMSQKEVRGRKTRILPAMDAKERFHQKRLGYIKCCIDAKHNIPLSSISMNRVSRHISVHGQIVVRTCQSGSPKCYKIP